MRKMWVHRFLVSVAFFGTLIIPVASASANAPKHSDDSVSVAQTDPLFAEPYIDKDEWRNAPVRHRYIHGGFKGTDTRFSIYLPPKKQYKARFFQHITPVPDDENLAQKDPVGSYNKIGFSIASGAYFLETNGGGKMDLGKVRGPASDANVTAFRANAAAAQYSRVIVQQLYGGKRPFGYAYGGSGGAYRTIGSIENTKGVWDGVVPYVPGSTMAIPNMFTVRMHAMRILKDKFPRIVDAVEPGGSGDPYAGLTPREAEALREITLMGFPLKSWYGYKNMGIHGFAALYQGMVGIDPTYFTDFWTKPGYLGFDKPEEFVGARLQFPSTVAAPVTVAEAARLRINLDASSAGDRGGVDSAFRIPEGAEGARVAAFRLSGSPPPVDFIGGDLIVKSGAAKGKSLPLSRIVGDVAVLGLADVDVAKLITAGDEVQVDNSNFLAAQTYHRHQVPGPDFKVWDQFRDAQGKAIYPQRPMLIGPIFVRGTSGSTQTGKFEGKMILVASLWDREALPWQADWYRQRAAANFGVSADEHLRLYYTDHALHGDELGLEDPSRVVSYNGVLQQALRDLSAWVEKGTPPPASTEYTINEGQVIVPASAPMRKGLQPVVTLTVNGVDRADAAVGQPVTFIGTIAVPPGGGKVVEAKWDFTGAGEFPFSSKIAKRAGVVKITTTHRFEKPGTYFVALRGTAQRADAINSPYAKLQNLGRVRVVVKQ